jgi:hypothetical protein
MTSPSRPSTATRSCRRWTYVSRRIVIISNALLQLRIDYWILVSVLVCVDCLVITCWLLPIRIHCQCAHTFPFQELILHPSRKSKGICLCKLPDSKFSENQNLLVRCVKITNPFTFSNPIPGLYFHARANHQMFPRNSTSHNSYPFFFWTTYPFKLVSYLCTKQFKTCKGWFFFQVLK